MHYLDLENWPRRTIFDFFRAFAQPFWHVTAEVDVTAIRHQCSQDAGLSFAAAYHFMALKAANEIESFRYRIEGDQVIVHDRIHAGTTVLLDDDTFTLCYFDYDEDFATFSRQMQARLDDARAGLVPFEPKDERTDLVHFTSIPWVRFTSVQHPRRPIEGDSVPKIAFGKCHFDGERYRLPVAVDAHHALIDGLHIGRLFERMEQLAGAPL